MISFTDAGLKEYTMMVKGCDAGVAGGTVVGTKGGAEIADWTIIVVGSLRRL